MRQKTVITKLLQSVTDCYYKVRQVLQNVTGCYYKVRRVLQSATVITKWNVTMETEMVNEKPNQPDSTFAFPKTAFAKQSRLCQAQWFVEYNWLDRNKVNYNVTCFICNKHLQKLDQEKNIKDVCSTKIRSYSPAVSRCHCYCKLVRRIKGQQKTHVW